MDFYTKGIDFINSAKREEEVHNNKAKALQDYIRGIQYFITGLKYDKNERTRQIVHKKVIEYFDAAERIKAEHGQAEQQVQQRANQAANSSAASKENLRLREALENTIMKEKPDINWDDVVGMHSAKRALEEAVILPQKYPQLFTGKRQAWKTILLFGPPGTGKTYLAKALASRAEATFISVSSADLVSKYVGESERLIRELFKMAQDNKPAIIFIDEIDAISTTRSDTDTDSIRRIKNELLIRLQEVADKQGILVIGTTNREWELDPALRRRFDRMIYIPLPDAEEREQILKVHMSGEPSLLNSHDYKQFAIKTEGYSGSDLATVVRDALMQPVRKAMRSQFFKKVHMPSGEERIVACGPNDRGAFAADMLSLPDPLKLKLPDVSKADFETALARSKPSVGKDDLRKHEEFIKKFIGEQQLAFDKVADQEIAAASSLPPIPTMYQQQQQQQQYQQQQATTSGGGTAANNNNNNKRVYVDLTTSDDEEEEEEEDEEEQEEAEEEEDKYESSRRHRRPAASSM